MRDNALSLDLYEPGQVQDISNVDIFAAGTYRGKEYTESDLDEICRNFYELAENPNIRLSVPFVLGHEEDQSRLEEFLDRTDLPAAAYLENPRRKGKKIIGDMCNVPEKIANLIRNKVYGHVSAEIYDDVNPFRDNDENIYGKAFRRIALLGGEQPQVKGLKPVWESLAAGTIRPSASVYSERAKASRKIYPTSFVSKNRNTVFCFSEFTIMDRNALIQQIMAAMPGLQESTLQGMTDDMLSDMAANLPGGTPPTDPMMMAEGKEQLISELTALGQDPVALEAMDEAALQALLDQLKGADATTDMADVDGVQMTAEEMKAALLAQGKTEEELAGLDEEGLAALLRTGGGSTEPVAPMNDPSKFQMYSEQQLKRLNATNKMINEAQAKLNKKLREAKKVEVQTFCEEKLRQGKFLPHQLNDYIELGMKKDDRIVCKFSDSKGKVVKRTCYEQWKAEINARPNVAHFGERIKPNKGKSIGEEAMIIQRFAEEHASELKKLYNQKPEDIVRAFRAEKERNPDLTANEFIQATRS